jgi:hypothetical protein
VFINRHYPIAVLHKHTVVEHWFRVPAGPPFYVRKGNIFFFIFLCPHPDWGKIFWPSAVSYFTHVHPVVTALKLTVEPDFWKFSLTFWVHRYIVLTSKRPLWPFTHALCGRFFPKENLITSTYKNYVKFRNWSANESRPSFVDRSVTAEKCVEGVTPDDEMGRRTRRIKNSDISFRQETEW